MQWFRYHTDTVNDPKIQSLAAEDFRLWVNLQCIAARHEGKLPPESEIAFTLRMTEDEVKFHLERFAGKVPNAPPNGVVNGIPNGVRNGVLNAPLIARCNGGPNGYHYAMLEWDKKQYKTDTSTPRVKRFRNATGNVSETAPDTEQNRVQNRTPLSPKTKAPKKSRGSYRFTGKVIKLNEADHEAWRKRFHAIPDIDGELEALDIWLQTQPPETQKKWFTGSVPGSLNRKHQEWVVKLRQQSEGGFRSSGDAYLDRLARQAEIEDGRV